MISDLLLDAPCWQCWQQGYTETDQETKLYTHDMSQVLAWTSKFLIIGKSKQSYLNH